MFNIHLITNPTFDKNTYQFERKKQTVDNKLKQITKQKELESKESKKIKINFHNSFVNKETHQKYDKLIQTNKQRNIIKQEKKLNKDDKDDKEDKDDKGKVMPNQEKLKPAHAERKENTIIHDSINTTNNISEVLLIESVSILKNKNFSQINDSNYDNTQDNIKTNKVLEIIEDEMIEDKIVEEEDEVQIEKDEKCEEFYCTYDKFLNDTNTGVSNDTIWKLKDQMKKVASNIKEKMKEQSSLKVEKKKNLLDILTSRLPILDNNDIPSNEHKIIEEYNFENNINSSEDINEEDITTIRDNIKDDDEDIVKYNEDNKFNHIADKTKNLDDNEESENILNINLEEFIKENTNDCIEFEREVIKPFNDQRLIIVDNYEDQRE